MTSGVNGSRVSHFVPGACTVVARAGHRAATREKPPQRRQVVTQRGGVGGRADENEPRTVLSGLLARRSRGAEGMCAGKRAGI
eukprot:scaffold61301_cov61-Phaeocystis_antarctica.AAC.1